VEFKGSTTDRHQIDGSLRTCRPLARPTSLWQSLDAPCPPTSHYLLEPSSGNSTGSHRTSGRQTGSQPRRRKAVRSDKHVSLRHTSLPLDRPCLSVRHRRLVGSRDYNVTTTPAQSTRSTINARNNTAGHSHFQPTPMNDGKHQRRLLIRRFWVRIPGGAPGRSNDPADPGHPDAREVWHTSGG